MVIAAVLKFLAGFAANWLPDLFSWVGTWFKDKQDVALEEKRIRLQIELEKAKGEIAANQRRLDAELEERLLAIHSDILDMKEAYHDRKDARAREVSSHKAVIGVLALADKMGVEQWLKSIGWFFALFLECFAAGVTPMIAFTVFSLWSAVKIALINRLWDMDKWYNAVAQVWNENDDDMLWAVLGYYLGARMKKRLENDRARA